MSPISQKKNLKLGRALATAAVMPMILACSALSAPIEAVFGTPTPSPSPTAMPTLPPTRTPSPTPAPTDTQTALPSDTPGPTPLPTVPLLYTAPPPRPDISSQLNCRLNWKSPGDGIFYDPLEVFTVGWNVKNTGSSTWSPDNVIFTYLEGAKLYDYPVVHLRSSVATGQSVTLSVRMRAPLNSTLYTTYWSLRQGDSFFCRVGVSIYVD